MKKVLSIVLVSILLIISLPFYSVSLEEKTTENYIYELDEENKIIILKRYIGTDADVVVPAMFMIDGVCYQTMVTSNFSSQTSTFSGTSVHSIIFEDGVKANCMSFMFKSCTELRWINQFPDYDGVWWSSCFNSCYNLIEAPQIPNDIENIRITAFFKNCYRLLGNYRMPDNYDENNAVGVFDGCDKINNETNVVWFGDSITAGTTTQGISFINFLNDRLANAKIANYGVGGHTLSYGYDGGETAISESIINDVGKFGVHEHIDYVFVSAGTNDYAHNSSRRPYGSYRFADIGSPTDKGMNTVSGAVYNLVKIIETKFPNAEIIFTTPISRAKYDVIGSSATDNSERLIFLKDYVDGIKAACTENGVRFIDTYAESGFDAQLDLCDGTGLYETDMTHPTMLGQEKLADFYLEKLVTTFNFIEKPKTGHAYSDWQVLTEPQCTAPGKCMRRCSVCSYCEYQELHSLSHEYADEYTFDILPTCYTDGSKSRHCSRCDSRIDSTVIPATNHIDKCYCYEYKILSEEEKTIEITGYIGKELKVVIPATIDGYTVISIGESTFAENSTIVSVELPNTVKTIGKNAFFLCYNLTKVVLPESLTTIQYGAFSYCAELININFPESLTSIEANAFAYCSSLEEINIPSGINCINKHTFNSCDNLVRVIIPENVEIIDEYAFGYCSSLADIWLPASIDVICKNAFSYSNAFSTVYYAGAKTDWNNITIADNKISNNAQIHYNVPVETIDCHWTEYTIDATCTEDGEFGYECPCGYKTSTSIPSLGHDFMGDWITTIEPTCEDDGLTQTSCLNCGEMEYKTIDAFGHNYVDGTCVNCGEKDPASLNGWILEDDKWAYYENGTKIINKWVKDSVGWCYLGADGYCVTNCWKADSHGWCYLDSNGRMVVNNWVKDNGKWYFMDGNGYMVSNCWKKDSKGWCYLGSSGAMLTNAWVKDSVGWCYVGADGYCVTNCWKADSYGWCYLDANGRVVTNKWIKYGGNWYYLDGNGYMVTGRQKIDGKYYSFAPNGALK